MAEDIRLSVGADTTQMESQIANAARKATVVIRPTIDSKGLEKISAPLGRITGQADEFSKSMEAANARVLAFGASVGVLNAVAKSFQNIVTASTQVEASLKEIQVATGETTGNLEKLGKGIFEVARSTGLSFKQASEATLEFARQGGTLEDSLMKAKAALVLTRTTGLDAAEAVKGLTAAVLSFNQVGLDYETVVNKLAAVDTKFAVSSRDLIEGISRSASVAQEAGVSFDELTALITTLQEKTARGGAVIGNALKTIFQRVQTTENLDYIRNLGIAVNDASGDILPATTIIKKLADEFQNLDSATRKGLLIKIGGGFQIDKLAALLNDISSANGTFNRSLEQSSNAGNQGFKKLDELNKTVQASFDRLTTSGTQFAATIGKIAFSDDFRSILNKTSSFLESLNESISGGEEGGATIGKAIVKGIGSVITGPGALLIAGLGIKLFGDLAKFGVDSLKNQLGVTNIKKEQQDIEKSILGLLLQNTAVQTKIVSLEGNKTAQAEYLLSLYSKQAATLEKMSKLSKEIGPSVYEGGIRLTTEGTKNVKTKTAAGGYMSKDVARRMEMQEAPAGASIKEISNFNFGPKEGRGTMMVNSMESVYKTPMGDFVIPSYSRTRTGKPTLFSASGYVPNFAEKEEEKEKAKLLKSLTIDGGAYSFAGLTIGGTGLKSIRSKEISPQLLSQIKDPSLTEALSKYNKLNFSNVSVGNIYRRRDQNLDSLEASEEQIKNHFLKKANDALSPQIGSFIKDELDSLGIKPTASMQYAIKSGKKFDFVNDSMAGTFFETMLKLANMSASDDNFGQFFNDSNSRFDIYGLKPDIAEQYGLPKRFWEYVEIKSSEKALNEELSTKFIQQLSQAGGESLKAKFLAQAKTGAKGYVPNFAINGLASNIEVLAGRVFESLLRGDEYLDLTENNIAPDIDKGYYKVNEAKMSVNAALVDSNFGKGKGKGNSVIVPKDSSTESDEALKNKKGSKITRPNSDKFLRGNIFKIARKILERESKNKNTNYSKIKMATSAAEGYVPNFAGTTNFEGSASRYGYKIGQVYNKGEEAIKATFNNPTTAFSGTVVGKESYDKYGVTVDEKGIIASILGNNTFVAGEDQRSVLESLATRLSSQGAMIKGSGFNIAGIQGGKLAVNPEQVISAKIKGKFKKIDYEKLDKIFPRFWKSKGLGDVWEKTKLAATYKVSPTSFFEIIKDRPDLQESLRSPSWLRENNALLRNAAVEAVLKKDPSVAGFLVDIANSSDEDFLKRQGYGDVGIKYAMPFSGEPFSDIESKELKQKKIQSQIDAKKQADSYKNQIESFKKNGILYKDYKNPELIAKYQFSKLGRWGNYDQLSKRIFLLSDQAKTAAKGYIPNFSKEAILDAISREQKESGLPLSAIKVVQDARVRGPQNPDGYAVINNRDEPNGKVPNFAEPPKIDQDLFNAIEEALNNLQNSTGSLDESFERIAKNLSTNVETVNQVLDKMTPTVNAAAESMQKVTESGKKNTDQGNKDAQGKKTANEKETKTTQDALYNLVKFQTALSFATGAMSSFGKSGEKLAEILSSVGQSAYLFSQAKELGSSIAGEGGVSGGFKAGKEAAKAAKESGGSQVGAFIKGGGGMAALGALTAGAGYAVAAYEGIKALDAGMQIWNGTVAKSEKFIEDLTTASEKYNIQLSEQQKRVVSAISEKAAGGTDIGSQVSIGLSKFFGTKDYQTFGGLQEMIGKLEKVNTDGQKILLEKLGNVIAPQATQQLTTDGNPNPTTSEVQLKTIDILTRKLKEFEQISTTESPINRQQALDRRAAKFAEEKITDSGDKKFRLKAVNDQYDAIEKIEGKLSRLQYLRNPSLSLKPESQEELNKLSKEEVDLQKQLSKLKQETFQKTFDASKYQQLITEYIKEQVAPAQQAAYAESQRQEAMLINANLLKEELDIQVKLKQLELSRISPRENFLSIEKDLLSTTEARRASIDLELKQLEEQRRLQLEIKSIVVNRGQQALDKYLGMTGSSLTQERKEELKGGFKKIIDAGSIKESEDAIRKFNSQLNFTKTSQEEIAKKIQEQISLTQSQLASAEEFGNYNGKTADQLKNQLSAEQTKLETMGAQNILLETMLNIMGQQIDYAKKATAEKLRQNAQDSLNLSITKQQNFYFNAERDALRAQLTLRDQALQKEKERLGYLREIQDAEIGITRIGKDTAKDKFSQRLEDIQREADRKKQDLKTRNEEIINANRAKVVQLLSERKETMPLAEEAMRGKTQDDLISALQKAYSVDKESFQSSVISAAKEFKKIVIQTAEYISPSEKTGETAPTESPIAIARKQAIESTSYGSKNKKGYTEDFEKQSLSLISQSNEMQEKIEEKKNQLKNAVSSKQSSEIIENFKYEINDLQEKLQSIADEYDALSLKLDPFAPPPETPNRQTTAAMANLQQPIDKKKAEEAIDKIKELEERTAIFAERSRTEFGLGMKESFNTIKEDVETFNNKLGKQIPMNFREGLVDAMKALSDPNATTSLKQRLLGVAAAFLNKINEALMQNAADQITKGVFNFAGKFASGGEIKGGSGYKDDVPAMLMDGEYVIKKNAVNKYGKHFFDKLNAGKIEPFAAGGLVGFEEANIKDTVVNPKNYIPFGQTRVGDLSFDENGKVIGLSSYTGKEENKADALAKAQTSYYEKNVQSGEGGFFIPGTYGQGAIMGQRDLLAYATQQTAGTQFDKISSGRGGASVNLAAGSRNLSLFGLRNQDDPMTADYLESKNKAKDLYFGGVDAQKEKFSIEEEARKRIEEFKAQLEKEKKAAKKAFMQSILTSAITSVAMAGLSKIGDSMASGWTATENASLASTGQSASFGDKFAGMFSGGMGADGMTYGGLSNVFNQRGSMDLSVIAGDGNAYQMNPLTKNYEWISNEKYNTMFPRGATYGASPSVNWGIGPNGMRMYAPIRRAAGGYVAGNGMGDNVPAMLNGGEFVVSKQAAEKIGYGNLQNLNSNQKPTTDSTELISRLEGKLEEIFDKVSGVGTINISVSSDGKDKNENSETSSNEEEKNRQMARKIKEVVMNVLKDEKRLGGMLR